ncbi:MAG: hypothetical protein K8T91_18625 [Planctomycetes bacterium]|nr:hypothetical protein [Planctomycetota bacterium]
MKFVAHFGERNSTPMMLHGTHSQETLGALNPSFAEMVRFATSCYVDVAGVAGTVGLPAAGRPDH